jgi:hypothetical protein
MSYFYFIFRVHCFQACFAVHYNIEYIWDIGPSPSLHHKQLGDHLVTVKYMSTLHEEQARCSLTSIIHSGKFSSKEDFEAIPHVSLTKTCSMKT